MRYIFVDVDTGLVLLIYAENAFNSINCKVMLHNSKFICPIIGTYIVNCFATPSRSFIFREGEILSTEGTTQGVSTAIGAYVLDILPLITFLLQFVNLNEMNAKEVAFAGNFSVAGSLDSIKGYWNKLIASDPKHGYFTRPTKSYLILNKKKLIEAQNLFANSRVNITIERKRHLAAVIGST